MCTYILVEETTSLMQHKITYEKFCYTLKRLHLHKKHHE